MSFFDALMELLVGEGKLAAHPRYAILVFSVACGLMGVVVVLLDRLLYSIGRKSVLNLKYGRRWSDTMRLVGIWGFGAAFGGYLGSALDTFQITRLACFSVGVGWPFVLPRLIEGAKEKDEEEQQPAETEEGEEEEVQEEKVGKP